MFRYRGIGMGMDPEVFLRKKDTGEIFPACGLIGGTKEKPKRIDRKGHAIQEDNVMVEFNTPVIHNVKQLHFSVEFVLDHLRQRLPQFDLAIEASAIFDPKHLQSPQAQNFGCEPDYNAWTVQINPPPSQESLLRTCGGHEHFSWVGATLENTLPVIRALDMFQGVPSIVLDPDTERRSRYGKAGCFRPKEYGGEYRVLSNFWIASDKMREWAFNSAHRAFRWLNAGNTISTELGDRIQHIINSGNVAAATSFCQEFNLLEG